MYRTRLAPLLRAQFSSQDVAYALQHPAFANYQRELTRANASILPRKRTRGPGGGSYKYTHIVELAFQVHVGARFNRDLSRMVFWGLAGNLMDLGIKKSNKLPAEEREIIWDGSQFEDDDFPLGAPHNLARVVDFPQYFFDEDFISRDPGQPTFFTFEPRPAPGSKACVLLVPDMPLSEIKAKMLRILLSRAGSDEAREIAQEEAEGLHIIDLTSMLNRLDRRLKLRLDAQRMRGDIMDEDEGEDGSAANS